MSSPTNAGIVSLIDGSSNAIISAWLQAHRIAQQAAEEAARRAAIQGRTGQGAIRLATSGRALDAIQVALAHAGIRSQQAGIVGLNPLIDTAVARTKHAVGTSFTLPNESALRSILERGTRSMIRKNAILTVNANEAIKQALIHATIRGEGPADTAARMIKATNGVFGGGVASAVTIARTELIDANRASATATYEANSDIVVGWRWLTSLGPRTCPACWGLHNTLHETGETQDGHPNCRCTQIPVLADDPDKGDLGDPKSKFDKMSEAKQQAVLGPGRYAAYKDGKLKLADMAQKRENPGWRDSYQVAPLNPG